MILYNADHFINIVLNMLAKHIPKTNPLNNFDTRFMKKGDSYCS